MSPDSFILIQSPPPPNLPHSPLTMWKSYWANLTLDA
jgi:hypothetical protein